MELTDKIFREKWLETVYKKNSVLCAGLDPAEFGMGRGEKGLSYGVDKLNWALEYIEAVAPFSAAIKPNTQYWKNAIGMGNLSDITSFARHKGLVVIEDSKLADIGSTNDAGFFYAEQKRADAVTVALYAGNMKEAAEQARKRKIGLISMCLMSNPEYEREKNKLVPLKKIEKAYDQADCEHVKNMAYVKQYIQLANDARSWGVDGIVIGAPSAKNHITEAEIERVRYYVGNDMLVLLPGIGAQGGEADAIWKHFDKDNVIVNVGRGLMFPNGSNSTPQEQAEKAKYFQKMLNELRV